ncbi:MAG: hypothetical protein V4515_14290 [Chloroflexota bacterium]
MTIKARPTTYRGIPMRSRLEAKFAAFLDRSGLSWQYEPRAYADETGQYLPDFLIPGKPPTFIEVKPTIDQAEAAMEAMPRIWSSEPTAVLEIYFGDTPVILATKPGRSRFEPVQGNDWRAA